MAEKDRGVPIYFIKCPALNVMIYKTIKSFKDFSNILSWCCQCAGGLTGGMGVLDCAIKECQEEASIDSELLKSLKSVGCIRYTAVITLIIDTEMSPL